MAPPYGYNDGWYGGTIWEQWTTSGTAATSQIWNQWWTTSNTAATTQTIWVQWCGQAIQATPLYSLNPVPLQPPTPEQLEAQAERRRIAEQQRQEAVERRERIAAKARDLLVSVLNEAQREEFEKDGHFHVHTREGTRSYRLGPRIVPMRVKGEDGRRFSYCIHPAQSFPAEDTVAALKLLLDHDEQEFLRIANATYVGAVPVAA